MNVDVPCQPPAELAGVLGSVRRQPHSEKFRPKSSIGVRYSIAEGAVMQDAVLEDRR